MAIGLGDQGLDDHDESSPSGVSKVETTVDYSGLRNVVERRRTLDQVIYKAQ